MTNESQKDPTDRAQSGTIKNIGTWVAIVLLALLAIIGVLGFIPVSTNGIEPDPDPAADYDEAVRRFQEIVDAEKNIVNEAGGSLLMAHDGPTDEVFVFIHGTTNSPLQFVELGEIIHERGHNVLILKMPHHGLQSHDVGELANLKAEELQAYADDAADIAAGLGEETTVIGLSGGGAVAAWIAQNRDEVARALLLSPFFGVPELPSFLNTFLMNLASRVPSITLQNPAEPERDWVYRGEATRGVAEFLRLGRAVFDAAEESPPAVTEIYIVTTAVDDTADNGRTVELAEIWQSAGASITSFEFDEAADIPHNSVDPAADPDKKALVYAKILELLGEEPIQ